MLLKEIIERAFSHATGLEFRATTNLKKEPSVVYLMFEDVDKYIPIYNILLSRYQPLQLGLIFKVNNGKIDLTITDKDSDETIEREGLPYREESLRDFMRETPY